MTGRAGLRAEAQPPVVSAAEREQPAVLRRAHAVCLAHAHVRQPAERA